MIITDLHTHTDLSGDCTSPGRDMLTAAIEKGIKYYAITDHHDLDFPECGIDFSLDLKASRQQFCELKEAFKDRITLLHGIEFGLQPHLKDALGDLAAKGDYDFIIGSCHLAGGMDPYDANYFINRTRDQGYLFYFENMLACVENLEGFDSLGHMDYVIRYWRMDDHKKYEYKAFSEILDAILAALIRKDIALEVNTAGYPYKLNQPHPSYEVLERYHQLGGRLLTIGSDAHLPVNVASHYAIVEERLKGIGFDSYTVYEQRVPRQIGL